MGSVKTIWALVALVAVLMYIFIEVVVAGALPFLNTPGDMTQTTLEVVNNYGSQLETYNPQGSK